MADELKLWQLTDRAGGICAAHKTPNMPGQYPTQHLRLHCHTFLSVHLPDFSLAEASTSAKRCLQEIMHVMQHLLVPSVFTNHVQAC